MSEAIRRTWLPYLNDDVPAGCATPAETAAFELALGCQRLGALWIQRTPPALPPG